LKTPKSQQIRRFYIGKQMRKLNSNLFKIAQNCVKRAKKVIKSCESRKSQLTFFPTLISTAIIPMVRKKITKSLFCHILFKNKNEFLCISYKLCHLQNLYKTNGLFLNQSQDIYKSYNIIILHLGTFISFIYFSQPNAFYIFFCNQGEFALANGFDLFY